MATRARGESAGDVDYERHGVGYATQRRTDPRIAALVHEALGDARTIVNVGAGAGSYEPEGRHVIAIEPSKALRAQRPAHLWPAIDGVAENLPLDDGAVDAAMALITVHQWTDVSRGLGELRRVARGPVVVLTFDAEALERFWLADYVPDLVFAERRRFPPIATICAELGGTSDVVVVPVPIDCVDGFVEAYYARPERFLDPTVRLAQSAWSFVPPDVADRGVRELAGDLESGQWDERYGEWRRRPTFNGSLRLVVARRA